MLILNAAEVRRALPMVDAIAAMRTAFGALSGGKADVPQRAHLAVEGHSGLSLIMPAYLSEKGAEALAVKVVSLFDGNRSRGLARIQAAVLVLDPETGRPEALLEGATLTAIRTAAASALAADLLAKRDATTLAVIGAGVQARSHIEAICAVRPIERVFVYAPRVERVRELIEECSHVPGIAAAGSAAAAVREADIVCCTTTSRTPVFADADLSPGVHVSAVGSFTPGVAEVPPETVCRSFVVVDSREAAWAEAGDLIQPLEAGLIGRAHIRAELGELVLSGLGGRPAGAEVTLFKSVGVAVQDAAAASVAVLNARRLGIGTEVGWLT